VHGLVFGALHEYSEEALGRPAAEEVWAGRRYGLDETYADEEFLAQLEQVRAAVDAPLATVLRDLGAFTARHVFFRLYPGYYADSAGVFAFLLGIEDKIHDVVRATIAGAVPPKLHVRPLGDDSVLVSYTSERRLCHLLEGLVHGVAVHYGDAVALEEIQCMHRGDPGCVFTITREG
jgi:hypothetical protein